MSIYAVLRVSMQLPMSVEPMLQWMLARYADITVSPWPEFEETTCLPDISTASQTFRYRWPAWLDSLSQNFINEKDSANCSWLMRYNVACVCPTK